MEDKTKSELRLRNARCNVLIYLGNGYNTGDFSWIYRYFADDCVWESQWVLNAINGKENVKEYYKNKGEQIKNSDSKCAFQIVELPNEDLALKIKQKYDDKENEVLVEVKFEKDKLEIKRIDICIPNLYNYRVCDISKWDFDDYYQIF